jgi:hypothetical protein
VRLYPFFRFNCFSSCASLVPFSSFLFMFCYFFFQISTCGLIFGLGYLFLGNTFVYFSIYFKFHNNLMKTCVGIVFELIEHEV